MHEGGGSFGSKISRVAFWIAAFAFVFGAYLIAEKHLRILPPTEPVAVGRVTVDGESKLEDYLSALLFYLIIPAGTVLLARGLPRFHARISRSLPAGANHRLTSQLLFAAALVLSPFFALTTRKESWTLLLPPLLAWGVVALHRAWCGRLRWRQLFDPELLPFHGLIVCEAASWILFRYVASGRRIAHIPTLFLETLFVAFFVALLWTAALLNARGLALAGAGTIKRNFANFATGALPLLALAPAGLLMISEKTILLVVWPLTIASVLAAMSFSWGDRLRPATVRAAVAYVAVPLLLFCATIAATIALSDWIDLFHRGETLGPASDYLRGKVPYRDVFVLHGMLEDGLLDAWLMELFGRDFSVAAARAAVVSSLSFPLLWLLGWAMFRSLPLALLTVAIGYVTFLDQQRAAVALATALLVVLALRRSTPIRWTAAGALAGVALFFSLDIGLYSIIGSLATLAVVAGFSFRTGDAAPRKRIVVPVLSWLAGLIAGATPFAIYLWLHDALGAFFRDSFVTIPRIIDAVWSLSPPELTDVFRYDLSLRTLADFLLGEKIRFVLNPIVIGSALTWLVYRFIVRKLEHSDVVLASVTLFALVAQRSALGRADFHHQHFAAYLLSPVMVALFVAIRRSLAPSWKSDATTRALVAFGALAIAPLLVTALWIPDLINMRIDEITKYRPRRATADYLDPKGRAVDERIQALQAEVGRMIPRSAPLFDFSNQPALYFFLDRPNPTRFYQVPILSPAALQMETIAALERARPPLVIRRSPDLYDRFDGIENELRAPAVAAYLDDHYRFAKTVHGVDLYLRRSGKPRPLTSYRARIAIPDKADTSPRERLYFPSIGSLTGAASSRWQSDIIFMNPHSDPARVRLRYVSNRGSAERDVVVPPRQTLRGENIAVRWFGLDESSGSLIVEGRSSLMPIIRVRTRNTMNAGAGVLDAPLTAEQSAIATSELNELKIVGVLSGGDRRANITVLNISDVPARVIINVTTAKGEIVGLPVERTIAEGEQLLLIQANAPLGVPLTDDVTVHVRAYSGAIVGYATVVDGATGASQTIPGVPSRS